MTGKSSSAWAVDQKKIILAVEHTQVSHDGATDLLRCYYCWHLLHWGNPLAIWCQVASNMYTALLDKVMYVFISTVLNITSISITSTINQSFVYCSQRQSGMKCTRFWRVLVFFLYCSSVFQGVKAAAEFRPPSSRKMETLNSGLMLRSMDTTLTVGGAHSI